jgi:hypothetical protein
MCVWCEGMPQKKHHANARTKQKHRSAPRDTMKTRSKKSACTHTHRSIYEKLLSLHATEERKKMPRCHLRQRIPGDGELQRRLFTSQVRLSSGCTCCALRFTTAPLGDNPSRFCHSTANPVAGGRGGGWSGLRRRSAARRRRRPTYLRLHLTLGGAQRCEPLPLALAR